MLRSVFVEKTEESIHSSITWEGSGSVLGRVMWMMWVMMRGHAAHGARWVERRHWVERGHHGRGQEGRRRQRRGRRRRAWQVDALQDRLAHLLDLGHQLLLQSRETVTETCSYHHWRIHILLYWELPLNKEIKMLSVCSSVAFKALFRHAPLNVKLITVPTYTSKREMVTEIMCIYFVSLKHLPYFQGWFFSAAQSWRGFVVLSSDLITAGGALFVWAPLLSSLSLSHTVAVEVDINQRSPHGMVHTVLKLQ